MTATGSVSTHAAPDPARTKASTPIRMPPAMSTVEQPEYLSFRCPLTIEAADDSEKKM